MPNMRSLPKDEPVFVNLEKRLEEDLPTLHSRSTSAGTTPPPSPQVPMASPGSRRNIHMPYPLGPMTAAGDLQVTDAMQGLSQHDYPVQYPVQGTFIHYPTVRSTSLDEFYKERQFHSEPPMIAPPPGLEAYAEARVHQASPVKMGRLSDFAANAMAFAAASAAALKCLKKSPAAPTASSQVPPRAQQISLLDALQETETEDLEPKLGFPEMPTMGSTDHAIGTCKPCAFFHTKGCGNGVQCSFCHLCGPGEKKRRQKEKAAVQRLTKRM